MSEKWSKEKAWEWYNGIPWITGINFIPSTTINKTEWWQEYVLSTSRTVTTMDCMRDHNHQMG